MKIWSEKKNSPNIHSVPRREADHDQNGADVKKHKLLEMFYRLECSVSNAHMHDVQDGNWNYIPYSHLRFYKKLQELLEGRNTSTLKFLEMGCGLGTKMYIASAWCGIGIVHGIEINPHYCQIARHMLTGECGQIFCCDVREFKNYGDYDLIYSYGEVRHADGKVVKIVEEQRKVGSVFIQAFCGGTMCATTKTADGFQYIRPA